MGKPTPHRLLRTLDDLVRSDLAPARLSGSVVVAVKGTDAVTYWHAAFRDGALLGCGYLDGLPSDGDAVLVLDDAQALDVLDGDAPEGDVATFGDDALLLAFIDRYCAFTSFVDVRARN